MNKKTQLIAHRGYSGFAPENTMEAFILAGKQGFYGVECDIHVSKDHNFIVMHDLSLERMTNCNSLVRDLTTKEIKELTIISGNNINNYKNVRVPLLEEYLDVCIGYGMVPVIEIKSVITMEDLDNLMGKLREKGIEEKAHIISFHLEYLIYLRNRYPKLQIFYLVDDIKEEDIKLCKTYFMNIDANCRKLTQDKIINCHSNDILVNTYTVDDIKLAKYFSDVNIDFITTNILHEKMDQ